MVMNKRPKKVRATEARVHQGEMLRRVRKGEHIVIEKDGIPTAALIDVADYEEYRRLKSGDGSGTGPALSEDGRLTRLKRAFGSWKHLDTEKFKADIKASRRISTRPPVRFD